MSRTAPELGAFLRRLKLSERDAIIADAALEEIVRRCDFLERVGLDYLALGRSAPSLSGGEIQRVRLAAQLSADLRGALYVLDEPTIGLHPVDNERLLGALEVLVARGNTVVVVEHDEETMRRADYLVDLGPSGGSGGGRVMAAGLPKEVLNTPGSPTAATLKRPGAERAVVRQRPRVKTGDRLRLGPISHHNLRGVTAEFPLGRLCVVTGVSGSGKSSLVRDALGEALSAHLRGDKPAHGILHNAEQVRHIREIDQSPIGRTPASTPATYVGLFDTIRHFFAQLPEARMRGYQAGRFSFNVRGGRCEHCHGQGEVRHQMSFLPDVTVRCEACEGRRYSRETLAVRYNGHTIADLLQLTFDQAKELFASIPQLRRPLELLCEVGLGYLTLGQPSSTLSGGEAQRIKLVEELQKTGGRGTFYLMDEPSTGLHFVDLERLLGVLQRLVDRGDTVVVVEHNLDVIASADWVIDLGPGGGSAGGKVLYQGPLAGLLRQRTATAHYLREHLSAKGD